MRYIGKVSTDKGAYRSNNEDAILYRSVEKEDICFAMGIVCDGIGGLDDGEIASQFVVKAADTWFSSVAQWIDVKNADPELLLAHLRDGVEDWNFRLREYIEEKHLRTGTTMAVLVLLDNRGFIINVGDSRVYRYNKRNGLIQLTTDAIVTKMDGGRLKGYLDNYMGKRDDLWYYPFEMVVEDGDMFVFCSDGFYHNFSSEDAMHLYEGIRIGDTLEHICADAVNTMMARGERDNISMGIIYIARDEHSVKRSLFKRKL